MNLDAGAAGEGDKWQKGPRVKLTIMTWLKNSANNLQGLEDNGNKLRELDDASNDAEGLKDSGHDPEGLEVDGDDLKGLEDASKSWGVGSVLASAQTQLNFFSKKIIFRHRHKAHIPTHFK